jgi:hypothetical protein
MNEGEIDNVKPDNAGEQCVSSSNGAKSGFQITAREKQDIWHTQQIRLEAHLRRRDFIFTVAKSDRCVALTVI